MKGTKANVLEGIKLISVQLIMKLYSQKIYSIYSQKKALALYYYCESYPLCDNYCASFFFSFHLAALIISMVNGAPTHPSDRALG